MAAYTIVRPRNIIDVSGNPTDPSFLSQISKIRLVGLIFQSVYGLVTYFLLWQVCIQRNTGLHCDSFTLISFTDLGHYKFCGR